MIYQAMKGHRCCCCCCVASVVSGSVRPHRQQPTRLPRPLDSPGKNTGVGCHFLLQCMKVKSEREVAQSCPTLNDLMDHSVSSSSIHGIFRARVLEWGAIAFSVPDLDLFNYFLTEDTKVKNFENMLYGLIKSRFPNHIRREEIISYPKN